VKEPPQQLGRPSWPAGRMEQRLSAGTCPIALEAKVLRKSLSVRMREFRTAILIALGLAFICFGGAVVASTLLQ
jgi:hypothetical protein